MKKLLLILFSIPVLASAQSRKVQFEIDSSLYWEALRAVLVLEVDGKKDTLEFEACKSEVIELNEPCNGLLKVRTTKGQIHECSFSIIELKGDSVLALLMPNQPIEPIYLTKDDLRVTKGIYLFPTTTTYVGNDHTSKDSALIRILQLPSGLVDSIGGAPEIRGCRGSSGINIDPKSFEKPVPIPKTGLPGVAPEFENRSRKEESATKHLSGSTSEGDRK